jgi:hypothetical protein
MTHGTRSGYNNGCRCEACTEANTVASRSRRERIAGRPASTRVQSSVSETSAPVSKLPTVSSPRPSKAPIIPQSTTVGNPPRPTGTAVRPLARARADPSAGRDDWDAYAQLLSLYLAGVGPSPALLTLSAESEAYYSLAEDRSGLGGSDPLAFDRRED